MSEQVFASVLREIAHIKPRTVIMYHAGEPFMNSNFLSMVKRVKALGVFAATVTNEMLLDEEAIEGIVSSGLDVIEFSTAGSSPQENDEIRRGCNYLKLSQTIKQLTCLKNGFPAIMIANCQFKGMSERMRIPEFLIRDFTDYKVIFNPHRAIRWPGLPLNGFDLSPPLTELNRCSQVYKSISIRWNGDVVACCYDITSTYVVGNILETPLEELWRGERFEELRESIRSRNYLPTCQDCYIVKPGRVMTLKRQEV